MGWARRAALALGVGAVLAGGGLLAARAAVVQRAEATLEGRGLRWSQRVDGPLEVRWEEVEGDGLRVARIRALLAPRPRAVLEGVEVELATLGGGGGGSSGGGGGSGGIAGAAPRAPVPIAVEGATVRWRGEVLAEGLHGSLAPEVRLEGEGVAVRREGGRWAAQAERAVALGPLRAQARVEVAEGEGGLRVVVDAPAAVIEHPLLADGPLPPAPLHVEGWRAADGQLDATLRLGELQATVTGALHAAHLDLRLNADEQPLEAVIALFGQHVPEAEQARCQGTVGLTLHVEGSPAAGAQTPGEALTWRASPRAEDLRCEGLLVDVDGLRAGEVTWRARGPEGEPVVKRTGPGQALWTSWAEGRPVAEVIIASEDISFATHPGYDLSAIQEALDEAAAGDPRPRGGSTLTQQLAKNLFLDGERTLARKLRELLYTLDLEASLDKRHIAQLYLNVVELGPGLHGVGPAANAYFAKRPGGLTDREAAFLAALLPSPVTGHARALEGRFPDARIEAILDNLQRAGLRSAEEVARARRERLFVLPPLPQGDPSGAE